MADLPPRRLPAPLVLPAGAVTLLVVGAGMVVTDAAAGAIGLLVVVAMVVAATAVVAEPAATVLIALDGWLTAIAFTRAPFAQLRGGPIVWHAGLAIGIVATAGALAGALWRERQRRQLLAAMAAAATAEHPAAVDLAALAAADRRGLAELATAVEPRRRNLGAVTALVGVPLTTLLLVAARSHLSLADDLLVYLLLVVAITVVGGFWPAVTSAVAASLLLNWFFTEPVHTLTIDAPQNLLALLLFVSVAITVSSVVHLAARRAADAARSSAEAAALLDLAQTVLGGADSPRAILDQLTARSGGAADLLERVGEDWVLVAASRATLGRPATASGSRPPSPRLIIPVAPALRLHVSDEVLTISRRMLDGFAAQVVAALERERLRTQAAQAEVLGEANRVRTALLTAVSHDLRTPLASVKAAVSSLRQADVRWSPADEQDLLATVEEGADRLNALIGNLLDMSRVHAGALRPFLRPTSLDEVVPLALEGLDGLEGGGRVELDLPDALPLVVTDPGLLERVVANLAANALRFSPAGAAVEISARDEDGEVVLRVADHGPGVPEAERERIFEPFQRLGDQSVGGVGLGLAVARGFVDAMGCRLSADSTPGGGLTMQVTLRAASTSVAAP